MTLLSQCNGKKGEYGREWFHNTCKIQDRYKTIDDKPGEVFTCTFNAEYTWWHGNNKWSWQHPGIGFNNKLCREHLKGNTGFGSPTTR